MNTAAPPVYGLILAGGASSRMQRDKAALEYQGAIQLDRAFEMLSRHVPQVFVSVRETQVLDPTRARRPLVVDPPGATGGPIVGIRSAQAAVPDVAWLVVACDLPFLTDLALRQLLAGRDPSLLATAFRSTHDGLPEPLCAVWEPASAAALIRHQQSGKTCPRKFLINHPVKLLEPDDPRALDNINTPAEYAEAEDALSGAESRVQTMQLTIQYFALMREQAGRSQETLETQATTPADLYAELSARYHFTLAREQLKVAVNSDFADWSRRLVAGDTVVFIPPVAGG